MIRNTTTNNPNPAPKKTTKKALYRNIPQKSCLKKLLTNLHFEEINQISD